MKMPKFSIYIAACIAAALVFAGCNTIASHSFEDTLNDLEAIDAKHETSMYKERLDKVMLNIEDVEEMLEELDAIKLRLEHMEESEDLEASLLIVDFRENMLESELDMIKVRHIGSKGQIMDGFKCKDRDYIYNASLLTKSAVYKGADALGIFDKLTGLAVVSDINRSDIEFDDSDVHKMLTIANEGIKMSEPDGFCDNEEELTGDIV